MTNATLYVEEPCRQEGRAMKLILFGGVHGVGKTTLLDHVAEALGGDAQIFDPGVYFWKHLHEAKDKTTAEIEEMIIRDLLAVKETELVICNWHYAVWTESGHVPQLGYSNLKRLTAAMAPEAIVLIWVTASAEDVYARRVSDASRRKRKIDMRCIHEEIAATDRELKNHLEALRGHADVRLVLLDNTDLEAAKNLLVKMLGAEMHGK